MEEEEENILESVGDGNTAAIPMDAMTMDDLVGVHDISSLFTTAKNDNQTIKLERCGREGCKRELGPSSIQFSCPSCSLTLCSTHSGHPALKLPSCNTRICGECWAKRPENSTGMGRTRDWAVEWVGKRERFKAERRVRRSVLQERLDKMLANGDEQVVKWEPDGPTCPHCSSDFNMLAGRRRHHCRLCGSLVCSECKQMTVAVLSCPKCHSCLSFPGIIKVSPLDPLIPAYKSLSTCRSQLLSSTDNTLLSSALSRLHHARQTGDLPRIQAAQHDVGAVRETVRLVLEHYEGGVAEVEGLAVGDGSQRDRVIGAIVWQARQFIRELRGLGSVGESLDGMLGGKIDGNDEEVDTVNVEGTSLISRMTQWILPSTPPAPVQSQPPAMPANLSALLRKLSVLQEQKSQLAAYLEEARINRRFSDLCTLQAEIDHIEEEIGAVKRIISSN